MANITDPHRFLERFSGFLRGSKGLSNHVCRVLLVTCTACLGSVVITSHAESLDWQWAELHEIRESSVIHGTASAADAGS